MRSYFYCVLLGIGDEASDEGAASSEANLSLFKTKKLNEPNNVTSTTSGNFHEVQQHPNSSGASSLQEEPFTFEGIHDTLASLGAVGGCEKLKNEDKNVVAVPKNIQRNIISRERDGRKVRRSGEKPRNMLLPQQQQSGPAEVREARGFIPIKFRNDFESEQNDMVEADQGELRLIIIHL